MVPLSALFVAVAATAFVCCCLFGFFGMLVGYEFKKGDLSKRDMKIQILELQLDKLRNARTTYVEPNKQTNRIDWN